MKDLAVSSIDAAQGRGSRKASDRFGVTHDGTADGWRHDMHGFGPSGKVPTMSSALEPAGDIGRTVDALRLSEAHLRGILDAAFDAIVVIDDTQRIVQVNPAATAMFGHAAEALVGAPLGMLLPAPFRARHRLDVEGYARGDGCARPMSRARDVWALHADGHLFPVHAAVIRIPRRKLRSMALK